MAHNKLTAQSVPRSDGSCVTASCGTSADEKPLVLLPWTTTPPGAEVPGARFDMPPQHLPQHPDLGSQSDSSRLHQLCSASHPTHLREL